MRVNDVVTCEDLLKINNELSSRIKELEQENEALKRGTSEVGLLFYHEQQKTFKLEQQKAELIDVLNTVKNLFDNKVDIRRWIPIVTIRDLLNKLQKEN